MASWRALLVRAVRPRIACTVLLAMFVWVAWMAAEQPTEVVGIVVAGGQPVEGARVRFAGGKAHVASRAQGRFQISGTGARITAWKDGFFIGGSSAKSQPLKIELLPLPEMDNENYQWVDPRPSRENTKNCANCHAAIFEEWAASGHGRGLKNRRFLNLYDGTDWDGQPNKGWSLLRDQPDGASVCAACHAPSAPLNSPGYDDFRQLRGVDALGVHCDYCHKIASVRTDKLGLEHGRFAYDLLRPTEGQLFFGPLDDVDRGDDAYSPLYRKSEYCAACHEGTIFGLPVYTTYSEWLASPARRQGKQCQDCHHAPTGKLTNFAPGKGGIERDPRTLASHAMPGGEEAMLKRCLQVNVRVERLGDKLVVDVTTTAMDVGHYVPTGFVDRHVLLVVEAICGDGARANLVRGPTLPVEAGSGPSEGGGIEGLPGLLFAKRLEGEHGAKPVPFWRAARVLEDTRLRPETPIRGQWTFAATGIRQVKVRLIYRPFHRDVAREKGWPEGDIVVFERAWAAP